MLEIISRDAWSAIPSTRTDFITPPAQYVVLMNTNKKPCSSRDSCHKMTRRTQEFHVLIQRKPDIRYNFLIGGDATVYEGRGWSVLPDLPKKYNRYNQESLTIAYLGTYTATNVPKHMAEAAVNLVKLGMKDGLIAQDFQYLDITVEGKLTSWNTNQLRKNISAKSNHM